MLELSERIIILTLHYFGVFVDSSTPVFSQDLIHNNIFKRFKDLIKICKDVITSYVVRSILAIVHSA